MASIVGVWMFGVVICSLRPLLGWLMLWRLKNIGVSSPPDIVQAALIRMSERLRIRRSVHVLQSTIAKVPLVVGYLRPVILVPVSFLTHLPTEQLEAILAHELAHIRRHDFVVNLLQTAVETLFFYHPAVWWLSNQIRIEREHCCDDLVVSVQHNHVEYGRALVAVDELRGRASVLALGASDGSLLARIRRIVETEVRQKSPVAFDRCAVRVCCLLMIGLVGSFMLSTATLGLANPSDEPTASIEQEPRPDTVADDSVDAPYFTTEQQLNLPRVAAHGERWFFVDLDRVQLLNPPFPVEIDQKVLPYKVDAPDEAKLNAWLKENGVDLIVSSEPQPLNDGTGRLRQFVQTRSVRTQLKHVASLKPEAQAKGIWTWNAEPSTVEAKYERTDDSIFVSGFIPNSSSFEIDPESPDLNCFRTAENVIGVYVLEQPDFAKDELRLRIAHVADSHAKLQDVMFEKGDVLSGKAGATDPLPFRDDKRATIHVRILLEDGSQPMVRGESYRRVEFAGGNSSMSAEGRFVDQFTNRPAAGRIWFAHFADGFAPEFSETMNVRPSEERELTLVLKRGVSASLKLRDTDGQAIVGAAVKFYPQFDGGSIGPSTTRTTNEQGEMLLQHVADFPYRLSIRKAGYEPIARKLIRVEEAVDVVQTMTRSQLTSGIVRGATGVPAVGAKLRAIVEVYDGGANYLGGGVVNSGEIVTTTDAEGRFELDQLSPDLRRLFIVETADGARAIVHDLECGQQNVEIRVPERRDLLVRIKGDVTQLAQRRGQ